MRAPTSRDELGVGDVVLLAGSLIALAVIVAALMIGYSA